MYHVHHQGRKSDEQETREAVRSAETSLHLYRTTRCHLPEDGTLQQCLQKRHTILSFLLSVEFCSRNSMFRPTQLNIAVKDQDCNAFPLHSWDGITGWLFCFCVHCLPVSLNSLTEVMPSKEEFQHLQESDSSARQQEPFVCLRALLGAKDRQRGRVVGE
jgi:hypothetical protein